MSFLDNSGDIILDAVLTDTGRFRLAKGNGSFKIAKFAFGDEEINYNLYEKNHTSGSAYYDLKILQTPILEAFTNNTSTMHSKLVSIPKTNLLFMPVMKLNTDRGPTCQSNGFKDLFLVCTTVATENLFRTTASDATAAPAANGILMGVRPGGTTVNGGNDGSTGESDSSSRFIQLDQGLDTDKISQVFTLDPDLKENQYIIRMDNRLGRLVNDSGSPAPVNFIDDDNIATYYISKATSAGGGNHFYVGDIASAAGTQGWANWSDTSNTYTNTPLAGPVGTFLRMKIACSVSLNTSDFLYDTLGAVSSTPLTLSASPEAESSSVRYIDSMVKVIGATTGYSVDIPIRYIKLV